METRIARPTRKRHMSNPWSHFTLDRRSAAYWRVTFAHPPINTITAQTIVELSELVDRLEHGARAERRRLRQRQS